MKAKKALSKREARKSALRTCVNEESAKRDSMNASRRKYGCGLGK